MSGGKVIICRGPGGRQASEYDVSKIHGIHWARISGGVQKRSGGYSLYGYTPYEDAKDLVDCSGMHDFGYNDIKICILKSLNHSSPYREEYLELERQAGIKPKSIIALNRPIGGTPCTKRIIAILDTKNPITRGELRDIIIEEDYKGETFRSAIKRLYQQGRISMQGSANSPSQLISLKAKGAD